MAIRLSGRGSVALLVCTLLWALTWSGAAGAVPDDEEPAGERGDRYLEDAADRIGIHGAAWALVRDGEVVHAGVRGEDGDGDAVDEHTGFVLGSLSKPLLATVVMELVDAGDLRLSDRVAARLPAIGELSDGDEITVEQLLQHRSGLPSGTDLLDADDPDRTAADVVDDLGDVDLMAAPGEEEHYSSLGYVVLTAYLEEVTGDSFADLTEQALPLPDLGQSAAAAADIPGGYRGIAMPAQQAPYDGAGLGYGYSSGSVTTLAAFAVETLDDRKRLQRMTQVRGEQDTETGLGWRVNSADDEPRVFHTGMVAGYFTAVQLLPEQDLAVVLVTNRSGYLDQSRLYAMSEGLLHAAQDEDAALPGLPVTQLVIVLVATVWAGIAGWLVSRRGRVRPGLGVLLLVVLAIVPVVAALLAGIGVAQLMLWLPDLTIAIELIAVLGLLVALAARLRPWQDRARDRRDA